MNKNFSDYEIDAMLKNYCARRTQLAFDAPEKEKAMTKRKGFRYAVTALALVAVLSAGMFSGLLFNGNTTETKQNGFSITAYAAEATADEAAKKITNEDFVRIGKVDTKMIIQGSVMQDASGTSPNAVAVLQDFNIRCEGENIDKVSYKVENGDFFIDGDDKTFFGLKPSETEYVFTPERTGDEIYWHMYLDTEKSGKLFISEKECYSGFSVNYSEQEKLWESDGSEFSKIGLIIQFLNDTDKIMSDKEMYETAINKVVISITATYKDGTTETRKVRLNGKYDEDYGITVKAKLVD